MKVAIGCDHGGIVLKDSVIKAIVELGYEYVDYGTYDNASVDYPDYAEKVARAIIAGDADKGVLLCGTGIGISIAANKIKGIRCALCDNLFSAEMTRRHNDSNMLSMGARVISNNLALKIVDMFLETPFDGDRHQRRIDKMMAIENE